MTFRRRWIAILPVFIHLELHQMATGLAKVSDALPTDFGTLWHSHKHEQQDLALGKKQKGGFRRGDTAATVNSYINLT